jgi:hypothetical protein
MTDTPSCQTLLKDIGEQISEGWSSVNKLESLSYRLSGENDSDEEHDMEMLSFESQLDRIYISLCLLLEVLNYTALLQDFKTGFSKFEGKLTSLSMLPYIGEQHSDVLGYFWKYHRTVSSLFGIDVKEIDDRKQRSLFESILQNTAKIVYDRDIQPTSEADVRKCVYDILIQIRCAKFLSLKSQRHISQILEFALLRPPPSTSTP